MGNTPKPADVVGVHIGQVFLGKYRVDAILGQGGMGVVAECMHIALNERRAIKMLRKDVLGDADAVQRFMREAQAAAKLKSEYVAKVHDVGQFEDGVPYMEMEFLEGFDLGQLLDQRGAMQVPWACELMLQTCEALAEAHSLGIVHRDVKPTNLFVTWRPDGSSLIKVLDFGISKSPMGADMNLTQTQSLLGTPAYMSPEQMRSARMVDARTDIWSLGTVMYELIEARPPFHAESFSEMCVKVAVDPPASMTKAPPELQQVILRCLEKAPEHRYANMAELARDLVPFVQDHHQAEVLVERMSRMLRRSQGDLSGITRAPQRARELATGPVRAPVSNTEALVRRPRRWPVVLIGLVLLGGVIVTAAVISSSGVEHAPSQQAHEAVPEAKPAVPAPAPAPKPQPPPPPVPSEPVIDVKKVDPAPTPVKTAIDASTTRRGNTGTHKVHPVKSGAGSGSGSGAGARTSAGTNAGSDCDPFDNPHKCPSP